MQGPSPKSRSGARLVAVPLPAGTEFGYLNGGWDARPRAKGRGSGLDMRS